LAIPRILQISRARAFTQPNVSPPTRFVPQYGLPEYGPSTYAPLPASILFSKSVAEMAEQEKFSQIFKDFEKFKRIHPTTLALWNQLILVCTQAQEPSIALEYYNQMPKYSITPNEDTHRFLMIFFMQLENYERATQIFNNFKKQQLQDGGDKGLPVKMASLILAHYINKKVPITKLNLTVLDYTNIIQHCSSKHSLQSLRLICEAYIKKPPPGTSTHKKECLGLVAKLLNLMWPDLTPTEADGFRQLIQKMFPDQLKEAIISPDEEPRSDIHPGSPSSEPIKWPKKPKKRSHPRGEHRN